MPIVLRFVFFASLVVTSNSLLYASDVDSRITRR